MASYHVKYWFESDFREASGEIVTETVDSASPADVARDVQAKLSQPQFVIAPSFGPAQDGGLVVVNSPQVKYVEILPAGSTRY